MTTELRSIIASMLWMAALAPIVLLNACASRQVIPFRTIVGVCEEDASNPEKCSKHLVVQLRSASVPGDPSPFVGFVEFDDLGFQMPKEAINEVVGEIQDLSKSSDRPLLIVAFIHGWHHSADPKDGNVKSFQDFLRSLQVEENQSGFTKRQVVGVYLGWRGNDKTGFLSKPLSFDERKLSAIRIGQYGVQELLAELGEIRRADSRSRLVAVGHSFGGANLISAVYQTLINEIIVSNDFGPSKVGKLYGDLVILLNPAIEASRFETMQRRISSRTFHKCQPIVLASFTSEADSATRALFPVGQRVLFSEDDGSYAGDSPEDRETKEALVRSTYGWHAPYVTHRMSATSGGLLVRLSREEFDKAHQTWGTFRDGNGDFKVGGVSMALESRNYPSYAPVINAKVSSELVSSHTDIWRPEFLLALRALIGMESAKADSKSCEAYRESIN